jgi:hypothetical protein
MYQLFQLDGESGNFALVHQSENYVECTERKSVSSNSKFVILYDFAQRKNLTEAEELKIILELIEKSDGEITRVTKGVSVSKNADAVCCGPGNCFCVVANGRKQCEAQYCNPNGFCWWVKCNIPCGC